MPIARTHPARTLFGRSRSRVLVVSLLVATPWMGARAQRTSAAIAGVTLATAARAAGARVDRTRSATMKDTRGDRMLRRALIGTGGGAVAGLLVALVTTQQPTHVNPPAVVGGGAR
jgi:hypothetical protein